MISITGYYSEAHLIGCEKQFQEFFKNSEIMIVQFTERVVVSGVGKTPRNIHIVTSVLNGKYRISSFRTA